MCGQSLKPILFLPLRTDGTLKEQFSFYSILFFVFNVFPLFLSLSLSRTLTPRLPVGVSHCMHFCSYIDDRMRTRRPPNARLFYFRWHFWHAKVSTIFTCWPSQVGEGVKAHWVAAVLASEDLHCTRRFCFQLQLERCPA